MNDQPLVSVVLPVYNRPTVVGTIESVLKQTYENFELLIIDNASTDNTVKKIQAYHDPRIKLIVNDHNGGQTYSINRGLALAQGKYIAHIDADDLMLRDRLQKQVEFMELHPDYGLVGSWVRFIDFNDRLSITVQMPVSEKGMRLMQTVSCGMYHPTAMIRKRILDEHNLIYDPHVLYAQDYDMWRNIMKYSKACNLPEVLVYYRKGDNDGTKHAKEMHDEIYNIRRHVLEDQFKSNSNLQKKLEECIALELKPKKTLKETIGLWDFYQSYLKKYISKNDPDFEILQTHIKLHVYSACVNDNVTGWSKGLESVYHRLKNFRTKIGR